MTTLKNDSKVTKNENAVVGFFNNIGTMCGVPTNKIPVYRFQVEELLREDASVATHMDYLQENALCMGLYEGKLPEMDLKQPSTITEWENAFDALNNLDDSKKLKVELV